MADHTVRFLGNLQRLEPQPGDRFVLMTEDRLNRDAMESIQKIWSNFAGDGPKLLILESGMKLGVVAAAKD